MDYVTRNQWGARPPKAPYTQLVGSEGILVHHLGDSVERNPATTDYAALMRRTQDFHMDGRGWNDFAYGWAVGGGKIYAGRGWGAIDGADTGAGRVMHSVLWLGDSYKNPVPAGDMARIWEVIAEHQARYGQNDFVGGHRDVNATGCPGDALYALVQAGPPPRPTPPTLLTRSRTTMYTITNAAGAKERFCLRSNGEVWNQWQEIPGVTFSPWQRTFDGAWEGMSEPLRLGAATWIEIMGDAGFGPQTCTAMQTGPGQPWKIILTNELAKYLAGLK